MNIQIRENKNNNIIDQNKKIEIKLSDVGSFDNLDVALGFEVVSAPDGAGDVLHSSDAAGDVYLGYGDTLTPSMVLTLPSEGDYNIKIVAKNTVTSDGDITTTNLNTDGDLVSTTTVGPVPVITYVKSNIINLTYNSSDNAWI